LKGKWGFTGSVLKSISPKNVCILFETNPCNLHSRSVYDMYSKHVLDVDCQIQGRLKLMIELYVSEKTVTNPKSW
jgi:hypothetical protein